MYLGKELSPKEYYHHHSQEYSNPHAKGIESILIKLVPEVAGTVIDLGCGDGLVTKVLSKIITNQFIGVDSSAEMVHRYRVETSFPAIQKEFWEEMPQANTAIASYSLHLCPISWLAACGAWLRCAGVDKVIIITPIKRPKDIPGYETIKQSSYSVGPKGNNIHVYVFRPR